ncbi:hypothetical protein DSO52_19440 [Salmonella enterica]|nr:hypothetical protein [Salmonella enterica]
MGVTPLSNQSDPGFDHQFSRMKRVKSIRIGKSFITNLLNLKTIETHKDVWKQVGDGRTRNRTKDTGIFNQIAEKLRTFLKQSLFFSDFSHFCAA